MVEASPDALILLEESLVERSGPIGKFVLQKQIRELGITKDNIDDKSMRKLIKNTVAIAMFDPKVRDIVSKELINRFCGNVPSSDYPSI